MMEFICFTSDAHLTTLMDTRDFVYEHEHYFFSCYLRLLLHIAVVNNADLIQPYSHVIMILIPLTATEGPQYLICVTGIQDYGQLCVSSF